MKSIMLFLLGCLLLAPAPAAGSEEEAEVRFSVMRLSDRVLVLTEESPMKNNIVAIASRKGVIVVDTSGSFVTAAAARRVIERELGRGDFAFVVNTHHHWDHTRGNQVFADAHIIGHKRCAGAMRQDEEQREKVLEHMEQRLAKLRAQLDKLDPGSSEAAAVRDWIAFTSRNCRGLKEGFVLTPPNLSFADRMQLDLGDLTLKLIYFGSAHSGDDILVHVPEEGLLLTGDLFLDHELFDHDWMPLFGGMSELDVPRFIEVLDEVLASDSAVRLAVPGHQEIWSREKLGLWRDYIVQLWEAVVAAQKDAIDLKTLEARFPLPKEYFYLESRGHSRAEVLAFHRRNILAFWRQFKESAAGVLEKNIAEYGAEAAVKAFAQLRARESDYLFDEYEFNALGYKLLFAGRTEDAVSVFELNAEMHPDSWNVFDSLGEAHVIAGRTEKAIELYRKSLAINPDNEHGKKMLRRLRAEP